MQGRGGRAAAAEERLRHRHPATPSEGFLARLQGLPAGPGGDGDAPDEPFGRGRRFGEGVFPAPHHPRGHARSTAGPAPLDGFGYLPTAHGSTAVLPGGRGRSAFPVHEVGREADRSPWRGRRFAFAAASAVSLAAIALGGTLPLEYGSDTPLTAEGAGSSATPLDAEAR
ncbi:hypothetical protein GA0115239_113622, partial [Streptomyces sp. BpilaLS-43]